MSLRSAKGQLRAARDRSSSSSSCLLDFHIVLLRTRPLLGESGAQPTPCPVQRARGERRDSEERAAWLASVLPADQHQQLSVCLTYRRQRLKDATLLVSRLGRNLPAELLAQPLAEPTPAALSPTLIGEHVARSPVEPEAALTTEWNVVEPPPGNQKGLGEDIGGVFGVSAAAQRVAEDFPRVVW